MLFTNVRATNQIPTKAEVPLMFTTKVTPYSFKQFHVPSNVTVAKSPTTLPKPATTTTGKKVRWGEPFWNLFHVLAEKVSESEFSRLRVGLLNIIVTICSNLPCPDCTNHAVQYLNGINFNTIQTKQEFKLMIYNFHNSVNARKSYPIYPVESLVKYASGNLVPIIDNFFNHFLVNHQNFHLLADDIKRKRISANVRTWLRQNLSSFM